LIHEESDIRLYGGGEAVFAYPEIVVAGLDVGQHVCADRISSRGAIEIRPVVVQNDRSIRDYGTRGVAHCAIDRGLRLRVSCSRRQQTTSQDKQED
jgi:hypothetical protein